MDDNNRSRLQFMLSHFNELVNLYPQAHNALKFMELKLNEINEALNVKCCKQCKEAFLQKGFSRRTLFCGLKCRHIWHNLDRK